MYSIIKKFIFILILCSVSFSHTGNDFLSEYPFGKRASEMTDKEYYKSIEYVSLLQGIVAGNNVTLAAADLDEVVSLFQKTCGMTYGQQLRILKKFCDNNPADTHRSFEMLVFLAFAELPSKSESECQDIINRVTK
jgi:hypothetical protein